jgi:hypothetical protein
MSGAGGSPNHNNLMSWTTNPMHSLLLTAKSSRVVVELRQSGVGATSPAFPIGIHVCPAEACRGGKVARRITSDEAKEARVAGHTDGYRQAYFVVCDMQDIPAGVYTIVPSTLEARCKATYTLDVYVCSSEEFVRDLTGAVIGDDDDSDDESIVEKAEDLPDVEDIGESKASETKASESKTGDELPESDAGPTAAPSSPRAADEQGTGGDATTSAEPEKRTSTPPANKNTSEGNVSNTMASTATTTLRRRWKELQELDAMAELARDLLGSDAREMRALQLQVASKFSM